MHKQLEQCALVTKLTVICIEILENEVNTSNDDAQIQSAYKSLVEIYMTCSNIERNWLALFRKAFESLINDQSIRDHCKVYNKYLKILKNLKDHAALLDQSIKMLELYPTEYIPLEMVCWIYVNKFDQNDLCVEEKLPKSIDIYADEVLEMNGQHPTPSALMAKALYLYKTANYAGARDFLNRGNFVGFCWCQNTFNCDHTIFNRYLSHLPSFSANNVSGDDDKLCLRLLAETHRKLHAFTSAEYYYTKIKTMNVNYMECLVQQKCHIKCQEIIKLIPSIEKDATLTDEEKQQLAVIRVK